MTGTAPQEPPEPGIPAALLLTLCPVALSSCGPKPPADLPNVVLVCVDTLRADRMPFHGCELETAPFLSSLAARGAVVERAFSTSSMTAPSVASMFTSVYPFQHGVVTGYGWGTARGEIIVNEIPARIETLGELMRARGYRTFAITDNPVVSAPAGFARGFDSYFNFPYRGAEAVNGKLAEWLDEIRSSEPYFLYLHFMDPHEPYFDREEHAFEIAVEDLPLQPPGLGGSFLEDERDSRRLRRRRHLRRWLGEDPEGEPAFVREAADNWRYYHSEIRYLDDHVRDAFGMLGVDDDDFVLFTADHGEEFLDHGDVSHKFTLYPELTRVPMFLFWPNGGVEPMRIGGVASLIDVMPTLREVVGLPPSAQDAGTSLLPFARGASVPDRMLLAMRTIEPSLEEIDEETREMAGVLTYPHFLTWLKGGRRFELYDLEADPKAWVDLYEEGSTRARDMYDAALRYMEEARTWERAYYVPETADQDKVDRLQELGYLGE